MPRDMFHKNTLKSEATTVSELIYYRIADFQHTEIETDI